MQDLSRFEADYFDLVVALGVYHNAQSREDWKLSMLESKRVLKTDGQVLVAIFSPRSEPQGTPLEAVSGAEQLYTGFSSGALYLLDAEALDVSMAQFGFNPVQPTQTVTAKTDLGFRVTVNGLYVTHD